MLPIPHQDLNLLRWVSLTFVNNLSHHRENGTQHVHVKFADSERNQKLFWGVVPHLYSKLHGGYPVYASLAYGVWTHADVLLQLVHVRKLSWTAMHLTTHKRLKTLYTYIKGLVSAWFFVCVKRITMFSKATFIFNCDVSFSLSSLV